MPTPFLRLLYICEFWLSMLTISSVWGQVGGQGHLDIMPWYDKLVLIVSLALVTVLGTVAAVSREKAWNGASITCLVAAILLVCAMGGVTYYYHLHEDEETTETESGVALLLGRAQRQGQA